MKNMEIFYLDYDYKKILIIGLGDSKSNIYFDALVENIFIC
jgi:hypothetical protein